MKKKWIGVAAVAVGFLVILGAAGNCDIGGDFTAATVQAVIGMAIIAAGALWVRYIEAKH